MQFIPVSELTASQADLSHHEPDVGISLPECYERCVTFINAKLGECDIAGKHSFEFSFYKLLGHDYPRHSHQLHRKVVADLKNAGYIIDYPIWSDSQEADGVIIISWRTETVRMQFVSGEI